MSVEQPADDPAPLRVVDECAAIGLTHARQQVPHVLAGARAGGSRAFGVPGAGTEGAVEVVQAGGQRGEARLLGPPDQRSSAMNARVPGEWVVRRAERER